MKKVTIIGKFETANGISDGQAVKTTIVAEEVERCFGEEKVSRINTYGWKKNPVKLFANCISAVHHSSNVIFMTDEGGIKIFPWLLRLSNVFGKCSLHYVVVGGWLTHFLQNHGFIRRCLQKFQWIYVETSVMKRDMETLGFQNILLMPNCKSLIPLKRDDLPERYAEPYRFCTFSRVMREKGIDDAVEAVQWVNAYFGRTACTLDIYGQIDPGQTNWFDSLQKTFPPEIRYCGIAPYGQSVDTLRGSFALLFPTEFFTEGVPGTIIDAYAAGVPVIASQWESFADVVEDGVTGIGYPFHEPEALKRVLVELVLCPEKAEQMRYACLRKAESYLPEQIMRVLLERLA